MAGSLEFGKLVAASFLYRYWDKINFLQKFYMSLATIILIAITSAGIFGFLSNAYQGATVEFEKQSTSLMFMEERLDQLQEDKVFLKDELEQSISELPENYRTAKKKLREDYQPQISEINKMMLNLKGEIGDLKTTLVETGVDVGPAIYLARIFQTDIDTVVKFFILVLIFVFDPMAVMFIISYNVALEHTEDEEDEQTVVTEKKKRWWEVYGEKKEEEYKDDEAATPDGTEKMTREEDVVEEPSPRVEKGAFSRKI